MRVSTQLAGHALAAEGAAHVLGGASGRAWVRSGDRRGEGLCQCGETSGELGSGAARRRWHRDHKARTLEALAGRGRS